MARRTHHAGPYNEVVVPELVELVRRLEEDGAEEDLDDGGTLRHAPSGQICSCPSFHIM